MIIECNTQAEADEAAARGDMIVWRGGHLVLRDSRAGLYGSSSATLHDSSRAELYDNSSAGLYDNSRAELYDNSRAELYDNSRATLYGNSSATLYDNSRAELYGNSSATLYGNSSATLYGNSRAFDGTTAAPLRRDQPRLILGPLGSRRAMLGVSFPDDGSEPIFYAGCWSGRLSEFVARVVKSYPTGRYGDEYRAAIAMVRAIAAIPQEDAR